MLYGYTESITPKEPVVDTEHDCYCALSLVLLMRATN